MSLPAGRPTGLKSTIRRILGSVGVNFRRQVMPGVSLFGLNVFRDRLRGRPRERSAYALDAALALKPRAVLDVGSGGGFHARAFADAGAEVVCVDFGTSIYAKSSTVRGLKVIHEDFNTYSPPEEKFDLVWASHVLEHQRNIGSFIDKLVNCCRTDGHVCITVPDPHRNLWGGHVTLWSPGLLAYNIVLSGLDISNARFIRGTTEFSILFTPKTVSLPPLTSDSGDLRLLGPFLPGALSENSDQWTEW